MKISQFSQTHEKGYVAMNYQISMSDEGNNSILIISVLAFKIWSLASPLDKGQEYSALQKFCCIPFCFRVQIWGLHHYFDLPINQLLLKDKRIKFFMI